MNVTRMFGSLQWECIAPGKHWRFDDGWGEFNLRWVSSAWFLDTPQGHGTEPLGELLRGAASLAQETILSMRPRPVDKPRRDHAIEDLTKTEELYQRVLDLVYGGPVYVQEINPDDIRRGLDRIFNQGKIIGRRTSVGLGNKVIDPDNDALIESWQRCVDSK